MIACYNQYTPNIQGISDNKVQRF